MENTNHQQPPNPYASTVASLPVKPKAAQPYPYVRVILGFALLGGATGGLILALGSALLDGMGEGIAAWLPVLLVFMIYGALLGLVPALLCGVWLALWQTRRNAAGLLHAALAGTVVSGLCLLLVAPDMSITVFGLLGGASAVLLVVLLLPAPVEAA